MGIKVIKNRLPKAIADNDEYRLNMLNPAEYLFQSGPNKWGPLGTALLYYPGGYTDTGPLELLVNARLHGEGDPWDFPITAIYVDVEASPDQVGEFCDAIMQLFSADGYQRTVLQSDHFGKRRADFYPKAHDPFFASIAEYAGRYPIPDDLYFGERITFPSINLNLIYLKTEAIQTYRLLQSLHIQPNIIALQDHGGYGGQFATYYGDSLLYRAAKTAPNFIYIEEGQEMWPGFIGVSTPHTDDGQMHDYARLLGVNQAYLDIERYSNRVYIGALTRQDCRDEQWQYLSGVLGQVGQDWVLKDKRSKRFQSLRLEVWDVELPAGMSKEIIFDVTKSFSGI